MRAPALRLLLTSFVAATIAAGTGARMLIHAQAGPDTAGLLGATKLRSIGPVNTSGRIDDFAVARVAGQPDAIYVATASGGVFKSTNAGTSWTPIFDKVDAMQSIGAIAVARSRPETIWVGTGEANNRQSSSWGDGVYKSTDAGATWTNMGLKDTHHIGRIVIDPVNAEVVYVAAGGHLWGPNRERGVFKTTDGGATWKQTLMVDEHTGATDIVIDPQNAKTLYVAMYQRQRTAWGYNGGGPGSGLYKSTDAGVTWRKVTKGLPAGDKGRIGLDIFKGEGKSTVVYAIVEAAGGGRGGGGAAAAAPEASAAPAAPGPGLYRSMDGENWEFLSAQNTRPSYYSQIRVDPKDKNRLYELGSNRGFYYSDDGGKSFKDRGASGVHGEDHALWVDPDNTNHLIIGGDGGVSISWDRGLTWDFRMNMPLGQFYEIDVDMKTPFTVCGGLQDNGEWCVPSAVRDRNGIAAADGWNIGGGDGFYVKIDPGDNNFAYAESQNGAARRVNLLTMEGQSIKPTGQGLRWEWDTPIHISPADPNVIYMAANVLFRSPDKGRTWAALGGDLSAQIDPNTLTMMGGPVPPGALSRNDGTSPYGALTSIGESRFDARVVYVGANDGTVQVTRDGGKTWTNLSASATRFPGLPPHTYVSTILPSVHAAGRVYATFDGHYGDDYRPYVYVSDDYGQTWRSLSAGLPPTSINRVREHPRSPHVLVLAHERGVHLSNDGGRTWMPLSLVTNFPTVSTDDAVIHPRDNALVLGTHGRGIWILDDIGVIEALTPEALKQDAVLAPIAPARQMVLHNPQAWFGTGTFFAPNPEFDAGINYYLREAAAGPVEIEITDRFGTHVQTMRGPGAKGVNRVRWNLRADVPAPPAPDPATVPIAGAAATGAAGAGRGGAGRGGAAGAGAGQGAAGRAGGGGGGGRGGGGGAALVPPGTYIVTLRVPGVTRELRAEVRVEADPLAGR